MGKNAERGAGAEALLHFGCVAASGRADGIAQCRMAYMRPAHCSSAASGSARAFATGGG